MQPLLQFVTQAVKYLMVQVQPKITPDYFLRGASQDIEDIVCFAN